MSNEAENQEENVTEAPVEMNEAPPAEGDELKLVEDVEKIDVGELADDVQAGDDALKQVAGIISGCVQRPLDLAARYGGEEFALVLYGPASDYITDLPDRLRVV